MNTPQQAKKAQEINCNTLQLNKIVKSLIIPIVFILYSCEREIDINPVDVEQELVVNALIQSDGTDSLVLSSTYLTSGTVSRDDEIQPGTSVLGATIGVIAQGDTIGRYIEENKGCYYYKGEKFQENKQYSLSIKHPDFQEVSASTIIPATPEIGFATYPDNGEKIKEITEADLQVLLEFDDTENTNDFYMISAYSTYEYAFNVGFPDVRDTVVAYTNPATINSKNNLIEIIFHRTGFQFAQNDIDWESYYRVSEYELYFSDKLINGNKVSVPLDVNLWGQLNSKHVLHVTLTSISEEYFLLLRSLATYDKSERGFFPEALQLYSNVNNGQGIWAAKSSKTISLDISELELFNYE